MSKKLKTLARAVTAGAFFIIGAIHLRSPEIFMQIVPPGFGDARVDVVISGLAEMAGGIGLLISHTRQAATIGLGLLLAAVWPANWYMALHAERFARYASASVLWLRVPLQVVLFACIAYAGRLR